MCECYFRRIWFCCCCVRVTHRRWLLFYLSCCVCRQPRRTSSYLSMFGFFFFLSASKPTRIVSLFGTYCVSFVNTFNVDIRRQTDVCPLPVTMWATKKKKTLSASTWASALSTEYYCLCWFDVAHILNRNTGTPSTERNAGVPMLLFLNNSHRMPETNLGHRQNIWIIYEIVTLDSRGTRLGRHERQKRRKWWIGE